MPKAATRTPPKRTRRVTAPFDDRLEIRCYSTEKAKLTAEAKARGLSVGDLVRFQLGDLMTAEPPKTAETPDPFLAAASEVPTDLADAIEASGLMSRGLATIRIHQGRVTVGDQTWGMTDIPEDLLPHVRVDGEPLPVQAPDGD